MSEQINIDELEQVAAQAAGPQLGGANFTMAELKFRATFDPMTVLTLINQLRALGGRAMHLERRLSDANGEALRLQGADQHALKLQAGHDEAVTRAKALEQERDALAAQLADAEHDRDEFKRVMNATAAKLKELEGQAERYRVLLSNVDHTQPVNARLVEALHSTIDLLWLEDSHSVEFDGTVMFGLSYDFSVLDRRIEFLWPGFNCIVWPGGYPDFKWSAYSTYEGSLWFEQFDSEAEARAVCMKLLADVMPDHAVSKAVVAIARAEAALTAPQPDASQAMTRDDVIRMAREAGIPIERAQFPQGDDMVGSHGLSLLARLVEQARGEEREACAAIIQDAATAAANNNDLRGYELLSALGRAIRARGEKP